MGVPKGRFWKLKPRIWTKYAIALEGKNFANTDIELANNERITTDRKKFTFVATLPLREVTLARGCKECSLLAPGNFLSDGSFSSSCAPGPEGPKALDGVCALFAYPGLLVVCIESPTATPLVQSLICFSLSLPIFLGTASQRVFSFWPILDPHSFFL